MKSLLYVLCCLALVFVFYQSPAHAVVAECSFMAQQQLEAKKQAEQKAQAEKKAKEEQQRNQRQDEKSDRTTTQQSTNAPADQAGRPDLTLPILPKFDENETVIRSASDNLRPLSPEDQQFLDDWRVLSWERRDGREITAYQNGVRTIADGKKMTVLYRGEVHSFNTHEHPENSLWQEQREILQRLERIRNNAEIETILEPGESYDHLPPATKHQWSTPRLPGTQR